MQEIKFYSVNARYGEFSNFANYPIRIKGKTWRTTEHYFQAQKFAGTKYETQIRKIKKPMEAAIAGRDKRKPLRRDWESVKDSIMYEALRAKFTQHTTLRELLINTGNAKIIEHTTNDSYWGDGGNGKGKNKLGKLLMRLREELRNEQGN